MLDALGIAWLLALAMRRLRGRLAGSSDTPDPAAGSSDTPDPAPEPELIDPSGGDVGLFERVPAWERWNNDRPTRSDRFARILFGIERAPLPSFTGLLEDPPNEGTKRTGICCSGGGIRSAAFNLGALQEMQAAQRLQSAKYVAAVSGGSYIAAAFAMVAKTGDPANDDSNPELVTDERPPFYRGSPEEQYLRNRSSYLAPAGAGKLRLVLRVALGLLLNLACLISGLVLLAWLLALYYRAAHGGLQAPGGEVVGDFRVWERDLTVAVAGIALALGVGAVLFEPSRDRLRQAAETLSLYGWALVAFGLVVAVGLPELIQYLRNTGVADTQDQVTGSDARGGIVVATGASFGGILVAVLVTLRSELSDEEVKKGVGWFRKLSAPLQRLIARTAAWVVGPLLLAGAFLLALLAMVSARHISALAIWVVVAVLALFWVFGNVTSWSLHPFYRRRLCTAFALKRVPRFEGDELGQAVERDYRRMVPLSRSGVEPGSGRPIKTWPTLIVCAAANVSDTGATPPGRGVTSFTFSPVAMGGPLIGGVPTYSFEEHILPRRRQDFTLAAAVAMSGAAVSPSMGKETRGAFRFLLGLANVRLGVWVPNPRRMKRWLETSRGFRTRFDRVHDHSRGLLEESPLAPGGRDQFHRGILSSPRPGPWYLVKELFGWSSVNDPYLYVTDGGHYENLGLVELLRRGCTEIFCFDATGGTSLSDLGDAIALARSELNVEIVDLDPAPLHEDEHRLAEKCCVRGTIVYPSGRRGVLIYIRSVVTALAPYDVQAFRLNDPVFPHHSTVDQLYTDQKFEAYRELGAHAARTAIVEAQSASAPAPPGPAPANGRALATALR